MLSPMARLSRRSLLLTTLAVGACARLEPRGPGAQAQQKAPPFTLPGHDGKSHTLAKLIARGPAVLIFYRGFW